MEYLIAFGLVLPAIIMLVIFIWVTDCCNHGKEDCDVPNWVVILFSTCASAFIVSFITILVIS